VASNIQECGKLTTAPRIRESVTGTALVRALQKAGRQFALNELFRTISREAGQPQKASNYPISTAFMNQTSFIVFKLNGWKHI